MSDIVFINSPMQAYGQNNRPTYTTTAPIGLGNLATITKNSRLETTLIDAEAEKLSIDEIVEQTEKLNPKVIGINVFSTNEKLVKRIIGYIDAPYKIIGGPHAHFMNPSEKNEYTLVRGETENHIINIINEKPTGIINTGKIKNLDSLPFVDRSLFTNDPYFKDKMTESSISTSRGCYGNCVYCSVPVINGKKIRARSIENVMQEIGELKKQGVNSVHFIDDLFNYSPKRFNDFIKTLEGSNISWRSLCRIDLLNTVDISRAKKSGCYQLGFGIEAGSKETLDYIGKSSDFKHIKTIFQSCKDNNIKTKAFFTIGYPDENDEDIRKTIELAKDISPDEARFMVVRAFPGTRLESDMLDRGSHKEDLSKYKQFSGEGISVKYHVMNISSLNGMSQDHLNKYIKEAYDLVGNT